MAAFAGGVGQPGYSRRTQEMFLSAVLSLLMLENGDPRREFYRGTADTRSAASNGRDSQSRGESVSWAGGDGYSAPPVAHAGLHRLAGEKYRRHRTGVGNTVPALAGNVRAAPQDPRVLLQYHPAYRFVAGREHPQIREPKDWTISICADFIAALARLNVDELSGIITTPARFIAWRPADEEQFPGVLPVCPAAFFIDYELWGWGRLQFSPYRHLATPNTPTFSRGVNPRVIDDPVWLRLIWASLNLRPEDMLTGIHYPFAMHRAMAVIWTHAGLRQNEILRLTTGCVQAQGEDIVEKTAASFPPVPCAT